MKRLLIVIGLVASLPAGAGAQEISVPSVTVANPGGYANPLTLDTDRYKREQSKKTGRTAKPATTRCSVDALPAGDRRRMEQEYVRRAKSDGKRSADLWVAEQGRRFRANLEAQGICPRTGSTKAAQTSPAKRNGKRGKCTQTVMQPRHIANPYGGAMSMIMVPVCVN